MAQVFLVECQVSGALHVEFARRRFRRFEEAMLSNQLVFSLRCTARGQNNAELKVHLSRYLGSFCFST